MHPQACDYPALREPQYATMPPAHTRIVTMLSRGPGTIVPGPRRCRFRVSRGSRAEPANARGGATSTWSWTRSDGCARASRHRPCRSHRESSADHRPGRSASTRRRLHARRECPGHGGAVPAAE